MHIDINNTPKFVINLKYRTDRLAQITNEMKWLCDNPNFERFEGVEYPNELNRNKAGMMGCGNSHLEIIKIAKERNYENVIIMEDDCIFQGKEKTMEYVQSCFDDVPEDYDMLFGGIYQGSNPIDSKKHWWKIKNFSSTHFYVIKNTAYDTVLKDYDPTTYHLDRYYAASNMNMYVPKLMFAIQSTGYSNIMERDVDYTYLLVKNGFCLL
jgi:glycosyl transferase, family 25